MDTRSASGIVKGGDRVAPEYPASLAGLPDLPLLFHPGVLSEYIMSDWETAIHETGHAVVGYRQGVWGDKLTIEPDHEKGWAGSWNSENVWAGGGNSHEVLLSYLAGREATRMLCGTDPPGSDDDEEKAEWIRQTFFPDRPMNEFRIETRQAIMEDRISIETIAKVLLESCPTLPDDEWSIVVDAMDEGEDWRTSLARLRMLKGKQPYYL